MKKYGPENLPAYGPIKTALAAPSDAPTRLSPDRRTRILNAARAAAAREFTFADRLARWFDFGFFPKTSTRYAVMRAVFPILLVVFIAAMMGGLLLPALGKASRRARVMRSIDAVTIEPVASEMLMELPPPRRDMQKIEELAFVRDADGAGEKKDPSDRRSEWRATLGDDVNGPADAPARGSAAPRADLASGFDMEKPMQGRPESKAKAEKEGAVSTLGKLRVVNARMARERLAEADKNEPAPPSAPEKPQESTFQPAGFNPFVEAAKNPFSTFAIDVDTASYTLTRHFLLQDRLPPPEAVRTEEFVNFFDYHYPAPVSTPFAVHAECAPAPFGPGLQLLRIGVKARHLGREENRPAMLMFLIDTSGSMSAPDRLDLVKQSLRLLVDKLAPEDRMAIVQYDSHARLVLDYTRAADKARILMTIDGLQTSGSTNLEEGMRLAYELARRAFQPGASNRVLLLSDGAANLGSASAEEILAVVADSRRQGIFCSVFGVGRGGYNDAMLETLANKGDGAYTFLDTLDEAKRVFVDDLAATLNTVASDVKIQVEFNPARVQVWRQLGYENRKLNKEDFRNDAVDAGEVGSGQSVTALYELSLVPNSKGPLGTVRVRCRDLRTGRI
ncbi:MAG: VWA domain-containing protein, partial [Lentisphaerae bacterium]|nr:VWA domain-containing protein [Lentisphaerota bacterium]